MKKIVLVLLSAVILLSGMEIAEAANKDTTLISALQKYLSDGEAAYIQALNDAKNLYEPQIATAQAKLLAAQNQFYQVNQVTILKTTTHSPSGAIGIDAVNCPATHPNCKHPVYKSNEFTAGEISTIYNFIGGDAAFFTSFNAEMNSGMLQTIDLQVKDGLISLNNPSGYNAAVNTIRTQYQNVLSLNQQYSMAKSEASTAVEDIRGMKPIISSAIKSVKRASANQSTFDKVFLTSFKFEYNAQRLDELARVPWTYISSLKSLRDAVSVTQQSEKADSISASYNNNAAAAMNATYGNLFLNEEEYRTAFKVVSGIFKSVTGKTLSGK
jgi:hypothetical protein